MTELQLAARAAGVITLGPGSRLVWWTQGCSLMPRCRGCMSPHTWHSTQGARTTVAQELGWAARMLMSHPAISGVTISGGEPSDQAEPVTELLEGLRALPSPRPLDVLVFSGRSPRMLAARWPQLPNVADALIAGRYMPARAQPVPLVASSNQELIVFSELGRRRWAEPPEGGLQLSAHGGRITVVGVPAPGELESLHAALEEA